MSVGPKIFCPLVKKKETISDFRAFADVGIVRSILFSTANFNNPVKLSSLISTGITLSDGTQNPGAVYSLPIFGLLYNFLQRADAAPLFPTINMFNFSFIR